ncbi:MAG TPA: hypothetical protein VM681_09050 [Candidatus Thermoplasmatota archaeon]|nr:hypothetical protein [Candidatus Thermoplasmatota archaeon]
MSFGYKFFKNYMLPFSGSFFFVFLGLLLFSLFGAGLAPEAFASYIAAVREWNLLLMPVSGFVALVACYYFVEQVYLRRKFAKTLRVEKKSDVLAIRKEAEEIARRLPDSYKKRIDPALEGVATSSRSKRGL